MRCKSSCLYINILRWKSNVFCRDLLQNLMWIHDVSLKCKHRTVFFKYFEYSWNPFSELGAVAINPWDPPKPIFILICSEYCSFVCISGFNRAEFSVRTSNEMKKLCPNPEKVGWAVGLGPKIPKALKMPDSEFSGSPGGSVGSKSGRSIHIANNTQIYEHSKNNLTWNLFPQVFHWFSIIKLQQRTKS